MVEAGGLKRQWAAGTQTVEECTKCQCVKCKIAGGNTRQQVDSCESESSQGNDDGHNGVLIGNEDAIPLAGASDASQERFKRAAPKGEAKGGRRRAKPKAKVSSEMQVD